MYGEPIPVVSNQPIQQPVPMPPPQAFVPTNGNGMLMPSLPTLLLGLDSWARRLPWYLWLLIGVGATWWWKGRNGRRLLGGE